MFEVRAVIFDLDDTLLKTAEIKWRQHKAVAKQFYGIDLTDDTLREHYGKPFDVMIGHLYQHADTIENMRTANRSIETDFPKEIQSDTNETLASLTARGLLLGVLTSIDTAFALNDLRIAGIPPNQFLFIQGADQTDYHKPDPRVFEPSLATLAEHGIKPEEAVYVGDALIDYQAARDAHLHFIGVATGFVTLEAFTGAGAIATPSLTELPELLDLSPHVT